MDIYVWFFNLIQTKNSNEKQFMPYAAATFPNFHKFMSHKNARNCQTNVKNVSKKRNTTKIERRKKKLNEKTRVTAKAIKL